MATLLTEGGESTAGRTPTRNQWAPEEVLRTVGMWSALATATALALGALTYVLEGTWTGMATYVREFNNGELVVWVFFALIALFFVPTVVSIHMATPERQRIFSLTGLGFSLMYATICIATCVLQFTYVRYRIDDGNLAVLEPWASASPRSATFALDNLAFFLQGVATLCLAPLFGGNRITNSIRRLFIVNAIGCFVLILLASFMGFDTSGRHALYLGTTVVWAAILGAALVLVGLAFQRRLFPAVSPTREA